MKNLAPIILFVYNRPLHTLQTLEALSKNYLAENSTLYIYADGPKEDSSHETLKAIHETRKLLRLKKWCKETIVIESNTNKGLANSIIQGVTEVINQHGKVIVLEDDLITSRGFLEFMNKALTTYEENKIVMHVSGYMYPVSSKVENATVFLRILSCWGWATWKRAWDYFSGDVEKHLKHLNSKKKITRFNILGSAPFYNQLIDNYRGTIDTWAVKWYASWYLENGISLFPSTTLVVNIGHDGSGVHCGIDNDYQPNFVANAIEVKSFAANEIKEDQQYLKLIDKFYKKINRPVSPVNSMKIIFLAKMKALNLLKYILK